MSWRCSIAVLVLPIVLRGTIAGSRLRAFFAFLNGLRRDGYRIDARHIAAAQCLLAGARAEGADSPAARRIKFRLAPLIAKSASEQQDFYRRFDNWQRDLALLRRPPGNTPATGPAIEATKHDQRRWVIAGALTVFLAFSGSNLVFLATARETVVIEPPPPAAPPERGGGPMVCRRSGLQRPGSESPHYTMPPGLLLPVPPC